MTPPRRPAEAASDGPDAVLDALLAELRAAPDATRAAAALTAVAAPRLLRGAGGEAGLARGLRNPLYAPLCGPATLERDAPQRIDDTARARLTARDADGVTAPFVISLKRTGDPPAWRVTGLQRAERDDA